MLKVKRLNEKAKMLTKAYEGDAGFDVCCMEDFLIVPGTCKTIDTGIAVEFEPNYVLMTRDKSGLATKDGIFNLGGVIDSNYRGEIKVCLGNFGLLTKYFKAGDKIAQFLLLPCYTGKEIIEVDEFTAETNRGSNGFGSTGR